MTPRAQIRIGNWNVRTMYITGKSAQIARVMNQMKIQIMEIRRRTVEREREKAGWKNWSEVQIAEADRADWPSCVEALCATWHEVDR